MKLLISLVALGAGLGLSRPAAACECADRAFVLPRDGHAAATNTKIFARGCEALELRDEALELVELEAETDLHGVTVRSPRAPLALDQSYTIGCGGLTSSFTVSHEADLTPPSTPVVTRGAFESDDPCGGGGQRPFELVVEPMGLVLLELEERNVASPVSQRDAFAADAAIVSAYVGARACTSNWSFDAHGLPYARWSSVDLAGNQSAWSATEVVIAGCAMMPTERRSAWLGTLVAIALLARHRRR